LLLFWNQLYLIIKHSLEHHWVLIQSHHFYVILDHLYCTLMTIDIASVLLVLKCSFFVWMVYTHLINWLIFLDILSDHRLGQLYWLRSFILIYYWAGSLMIDFNFVGLWPSICEQALSFTPRRRHFRNNSFFLLHRLCYLLLKTYILRDVSLQFTHSWNWSLIHNLIEI
jgi:ABC-type multidrug transport system permease subunit